jgi:hypothetical protein
VLKSYQITRGLIPSFALRVSGDIPQARILESVPQNKIEKTHLQERDLDLGRALEVNLGLNYLVFQLHTVLTTSITHL